MGIKKTHIILIILAVVVIGVIISTISDVSSYSDFEEAAQNPDREFHVIGKFNTMKPVELSMDTMERSFAFYMFDRKNIEKKVVFRGEKPQDIEKSEQVVIIGRMKDDIFNASNILLKCPSKYDKKGYNTEENFKSKK